MTESKTLNKKLFFKNNKLEILTEDCQKPSVEVFYSGINYKDALGVTGRGPIFKKDGIVPGIDFSGLALSGKFKGKKVIAQGSGFGESFDGGYTKFSSCSDEHLLELPEGLSMKEAMILGTAGFTAALSIHRMIINGQKPSMGPVLVSGATGGVGSFSIQILKSLGFRVTAFTHRAEEFGGYLKSLGACDVITPSGLYGELEVRALEKARWGGVIDNLGGEFLESVLPAVSPWGSVSSVGLAKGAGFKSTVMPFILRGVSLLGVSSTNCSKELREELWFKLSKEWKPKKILETLSKTVPLEEVLDSSHKILDHKSEMGRILVDLRK